MAAAPAARRRHTGKPIYDQTDCLVRRRRRWRRGAGPRRRARPCAQIKIGVAGPITGEYAAFGKQMSDGAELAVADINAKGGVLGQKLVLEVGDDACDAKQAVSVANQFASDGVEVRRRAFLLVHLDPGQQGLYRGRHPADHPGLDQPEIHRRRRAGTRFRTCGRDDQQGKVAGHYIASEFKDQQGRDPERQHRPTAKASPTRPRRR